MVSVLQLEVSSWYLPLSEYLPAQQAAAVSGNNWYYRKHRARRQLHILQTFNDSTFSVSSKPSLGTPWWTTANKLQGAGFGSAAPPVSGWWMRLWRRASSQVPPSMPLCPHRGLRFGKLGEASLLQGISPLHWLEHLEVGTSYLLTV